MSYRQLLALACVGVLAAGCTSGPAGLSADTVYVNGIVVTMNGDQTAEAVAVRGEEIVAVGTSDKVQALAGADTRVVDLDGKTMLPGFYAAHDHFPGSGRVAVSSVDLNSPPIGTIETMDELVAALSERAAGTPAGEWIQGRGYDDTLLAELRHPTRSDLDRVSTEHPIYISHTSGHLGVANSLALELARRRGPRSHPLHLTKPFAFDELLARLRAVARREPIPRAVVSTVGDLTLDSGGHDVCRGTRQLNLTPKEFRLLELLMRNDRRVLTRDVIIEAVWGHASDVKPNTVDAFISSLRRKLDGPHDTPLLQTVRGVGFSLREPEP